MITVTGRQKPLENSAYLAWTGFCLIYCKRLRYCDAKVDFESKFFKKSVPYVHAKQTAAFHDGRIVTFCLYYCEYYYYCYQLVNSVLDNQTLANTLQMTKRPKQVVIVFRLSGRMTSVCRRQTAVGTTSVSRWSWVWFSTSLSCSSSTPPVTITVATNVSPAMNLDPTHSISSSTLPVSSNKDDINYEQTEHRYSEHRCCKRWPKIAENFENAVVFCGRKQKNAIHWVLFTAGCGKKYLLKFFLPFS